MRKENIPYIIKLTTNSLVSGDSIPIGNSSVTLDGRNYGIPTTYSVGFEIPNKTYRSFLMSTITRPFEIGMIIIESNDSTVLTNPIQFTGSDIRGSKRAIVITPMLNTFQQITTRAIVRINEHFKNGFAITDESYLTVTGFYGATVIAKTGNVYKYIKLYLYPKIVASSLSGLGKKASRYKAPKRVDGVIFK